LSARPQPALRTSLSRLAVAGAATLASVLTMAPAAFAEPDSTTAQPAEPAAETPPPAADKPAAPEPAAEEAPAEEPPAETPPAVDPPAAEGAVDPVVEAGATKSAPAAARLAATTRPITVSAKIAEGAYVAPGTTTVGSTFRIDISGEDSINCTTSELVDGESFCLFPDGDGGQVRTLDVPVDADVTVTQTEAAPGLVLPPDSSISLDPVADESTPSLSPVVFNDFGPAPVTQTDEVDATQDTPIVIDVLGNDDSADPETTLALDPDAAPSHGTASLTDDGKHILYTPAEGYTGTDSFKYSVTNSNGTTSGTVAVDVAAEGPVTPDFGSQKFRVGVQVASGSYVTPGTTTAGSELTITYTNTDGSTPSFTCTTVAGAPGDPDSFCSGDTPFGAYTAPAGATVTVVQTKAAPGFVKSSDTQTLDPCVDGDPCSDDFNVASLVFDDTGLPPVARDDKATTDEGDAVKIDVLANDDSDDPDTTLAIDDQPEDGRAKVVGSPVPGAPSDVPSRLAAPDGGASILAVPSAGSLAVVYTPDAGFSGLDTFDYAVTNSNGTTRATVTVKVVGGVVVDQDEDAVLPDTGGPRAGLLGIGGLLLVAGGWLTARGRRRSSADAAR
jgi:hypothetical protein